METRIYECSVCGKETDYLQSYFDRFGIYCGKACSYDCSLSLPGRGTQWGYAPEEPLDPEDY